MFAVTGITGKVGAAVARSLLSADQPVRAVVRDRSRGAPWAQLGCDIAVADLSDTEALTAAFADTAGALHLQCERNAACSPLFPTGDYRSNREVVITPARSPSLISSFLYFKCNNEARSKIG